MVWCIYDVLWCGVSIAVGGVVYLLMFGGVVYRCLVVWCIDVWWCGASLFGGVVYLLMFGGVVYLLLFGGVVLSIAVWWCGVSIAVWWCGVIYCCLVVWCIY